MSSEVLERFFKLTLDNVYRFSCSLLFALMLVGLDVNSTPTGELRELVGWIGAPTGWVTPVEDWIAPRHQAVSAVATLILIVAVAFATRYQWGSRSGSTALLCVVLIVQVNDGWNIVVASFVVLVFVGLVTGIAKLMVPSNTPEWVTEWRRRVQNVFVTLLLAITYLASPLGWLLDQDSREIRGTRRNPLHIIALDDRHAPSGALPR